MWCGGNELHLEESHPGGKRRAPLTLEHSVLAALAALVAKEDPAHRFLPTSPYGPRFHSERDEFGQGLHHEVHGPWGVDGHPQPGDWESYWRDDDALFRGEVGVAGASSLNLIRRYAGDEPVWPPTTPLWQHASGWWTQWNRLSGQFSGLAADDALAAYVEFTQREQAEKLAFAVRAKKEQFPRCGGFLIWMGHDAFPCLANTSLVEFDRTLKPAAHAVAAVFHARLGKP
jgi:beta-mannosidase